jgi:hypothetical protein
LSADTSPIGSSSAPGLDNFAERNPNKEKFEPKPLSSLTDWLGRSAQFRVRAGLNRRLENE